MNYQSLQPSADSQPVVPSDSVDFVTPPRGIYVGGTGDVTCVFQVAMGQRSAPVTFKNVPVGSVLPIAPVRVNSTATTATLLIALF